MQTLGEGGVIGGSRLLVVINLSGCGEVGLLCMSHCGDREGVMGKLKDEVELIRTRWEESGDL